MPASFLHAKISLSELKQILCTDISTTVNLYIQLSCCVWKTLFAVTHAPPLSFTALLTPFPQWSLITGRRNVLQMLWLVLGILKFLTLYTKNCKQNKSSGFSLIQCSFCQVIHICSKLEIMTYLLPHFWTKYWYLIGFKTCESDL